MSALKWTTERPTVDGHYWIRPGEGWSPHVVAVRGGEVYPTGTEVSTALRDMHQGVEWAGPIAPPDEATSPGART